MHVAIHDARLDGGQAGVASSLGTFDLEQTLAELAQSGVAPLHKPIEMGGGAKRTTARDPDGNTVSVVQLAAAWIAAMPG